MIIQIIEGRLLGWVVGEGTTLYGLYIYAQPHWVYYFSRSGNDDGIDVR